MILLIKTLLTLNVKKGWKNMTKGRSPMLKGFLNLSSLIFTQTNAGVIYIQSYPSSGTAQKVAMLVHTFHAHFQLLIHVYLVDAKKFGKSKRLAKF